MNDNVYSITKELYNLLIRPKEEGGEGLETKENVIRYINRINKNSINKPTITDIRLI